MNTYYDINKYKNEMLIEQQMYAAQEAQNYDVNQTYIKEGMLPPSAMEDTRTVTQKLADMEFLKKTIIDELKQVANPQFASAVVEGVMKSPLNVDNSLMRYLANNVIEYVSLLKKRYGVGIRGDLNDVETMVNFLNRMYVDTKKTNQSIGDYVKSATNSANSDNTMNKENVGQILNELNNVLYLLKSKRYDLGQNDTDLLNEAIQTFQKIRDYMPTEGQLNDIKNITVNRELDDKELDYLQYINGYLEMLKKLPKPSIILNLIETIDKNLEYNNMKNVRQALQKINDYVLDFKKNNAQFRKYDNILDNVAEDRRQQFIDDRNRTRQQEDMAKKTQRVQVVNWDDLFNQQQQQPMQGNGLKKPRGRPKGTGLKYKDFGICEINPDRLNEDIITIRKKVGKRSLIGVPSKKVSNKLKNIITTISGGGIPKHNDIASLDDDEKEYLNKLVTSSKIDRLDIPAPSKDNREKLQHEFEVMKGQILAGNDNKDLVKNFKLLIRKLSKLKLLPKNDVEDLIDLLITLGY